MQYTSTGVRWVVMQPLKGSFRVLVLYDVAEQIHLDRLPDIIGVRPPGREPAFRHPAPEYVRFERPPVVEYLDPVSIATGEQFQSCVKYFDYGLSAWSLNCLSKRIGRIDEWGQSQSSAPPASLN